MLDEKETLALIRRAKEGEQEAKEALLSCVRETVLSVPGVQPLSREEFQALSQGLDLFQKAAPAS